MPAQDFELILRVQADLQTAVQQLRTLNDQMRVVKSSATEASGGLQTLTTAASNTESGIRGVSAQLKSLGLSAGSIGGQLRTIAGAFASLIAIREIGNFVKDVIDADQALGDMSQKVGVSTEALSALGDVAKRNGSDLQGVQSAFVNLARAGTGLNQTGVRALQAMNISLAQFKALKPEQQFDLVAQKFANYNDGANKAALATALFGKSGADLIPTLNQVGQQGLQNLTNQAIANGTAVGHDATEAAKKFSDALSTLQKDLKNAVNDGLVQLTPEIEKMAKLFEDPQFIQSLTDVAVAIAKVGEFAIQAAGKISEYTKAAAEAAAARVTGSAQSDSGLEALNDRLAAEKRELAARAKGPVAPDDMSSKPSHDATSEDVRAIHMSNEELTADIARLTAETQRYTKARDDANKKNKEATDKGNLPVGKKTNAPIVPGAASGDTDKTAQLAAKAQDDLTQALIRLQGQLDPTAAAYAQYNATVKQATDNAELAKKAKGADAQAIDSQRDAIIALAASVRDAALDQLAEKDRQAWEALRRSFETPAQVRVEDAIKQIQQLNDMLSKGVITAQQYHDALGQIGQKAVTGALPQYRGLGSSVGGDYGELQKNYQAQAALEAGYQAQKLALDKQFNDKDEAQHAAHLAAMAQLDQDYKNESLKIDQARGQLQLQAASTLFGQLATLSSSHNRRIAAIGKAAAIAQTVINTYQSATEAYAAMASIPYIGPALGVAAAAAAIAAGLANVAQIRAQQTGGYSEGGMTPPGGKFQVAGFVHAGEGVLSQEDIHALGGPSAFNAFRRSLRGFADGGFVNPLANAPSPAQMGFASPKAFPLHDVVANATSGERGNTADRVTVISKPVILMDKNDLAKEILETPNGERVTVHHVGNNPRAIQAKWQS